MVTPISPWCTAFLVLFLLYIIRGRHVRELLNSNERLSVYATQEMRISLEAEKKEHAAKTDLRACVKSTWRKAKKIF